MVSTRPPTKDLERLGKMLLTKDHKPDVEPELPDRDSHDKSADDLPPAYDALSLHHSTSRRENQYASSSTFRDPVVGTGSSADLPDNSGPASTKFPILNIDKSLPLPPSSVDDTPSSSRNTRSVVVQRPRARNNASWLSLLPFVSSFSAKRVRQSVLSVVNDLVVSPSRSSREEQKNMQEILASIAETCAEHKLSLSTILQEPSIADHTPMYWAIVNYREELLVALLVHSRPLSIQTISDVRRACLVSSNQALFHALRVCRPPFHKTEGLQVPSLRAASHNLLLGDRPLDEIYTQRTTDQGFVVSFDIPLWQRRMKVIGQVNIEFIASGRIWSVTFFSTDPASPLATSGKPRKGTNTWHVMVSLLESSLPTFFASQIVVDAPPPPVPESNRTSRLREVRSMTFPSSRNKQYQSQFPMYGYNSNGKAYSRSSRGDNSLAPAENDRSPSSFSSKLPPPIHPLRGSPSSSRLNAAAPPPISIRLEAGNRKLGPRVGSGEPPKPAEMPTTKPDTWSEHGVGYTNAVVSSLGEGLATQLLHDHSRYLFPDGTLRGRLEARFVKSESSKDCIIC